MPYYKDSNNKVYWLDADENSSKWLPQCVEISNSEAEILLEEINAEWKKEVEEKESNRQSAINKLMVLGLTEKEALALLTK